MSPPTLRPPFPPDGPPNLGRESPFPADMPRVGTFWLSDDGGARQERVQVVGSTEACRTEFGEQAYIAERLTEQEGLQSEGLMGLSVDGVIS